MTTTLRLLAPSLAAALATACSSPPTDVVVPTAETVDATAPTASTTAPRRPRKPRSTDVPPPPSHTPTEEDRAKAQALFERGRALMNEGKYAEACEAFSESDAHDPGIGTEVNLGVCWRKLGDDARACEAFENARAKAVVKGQDERLRVIDDMLASVPCPP